MISDTPFVNPEESAKEPISERLGRIIGYDFTNARLAKFIDENGHSNQIEALERNWLTQELQRRIADRVRQMETLFTEPVSRAAQIIQLQMQRERPGVKWVSLDLVIPRAVHMVEEEREDWYDAHADLWYSPRKKG